MSKQLIPLGHGRVYRHPKTGEIVVDTDSLRRRGFAGEVAGFGDDPYDDVGDDEDDFGEDDDFGDEDDDDFGDEEEDFGDEDDDDVLGDDEELGDEVGRRRRHRRRRHHRRRGRSRHRGRGRHRPHGRRHSRGSRKPKVKWGKTLISGSASNAVAGGAVTLQIRLQHHFRAKDITFTETTPGAGATVNSIYFGDRLVWSNTTGIGIGVFATTGFLRGLLEGQSLAAGLDIVVQGHVGAAGDALTAALVGEKPVHR